MDINILQLMRILNFREGKLNDFFDQTLILEQEGNYKPTAALWDAEEAGDIEITENKKGENIIKDTGKLHQRTYSEDVRQAIERIVARYYREGRAVTKNQLESYLFSPDRFTSLKLHEYLCTLDWLVSEGILWREELNIPADKTFSRPERNFILFMPFKAKDENLADKLKKEWLSNFKDK